jgi:methionyl-tRNA synthetase
MKNNKFYITTTIPYANAPPHIGFALEIVQADVLARWNKLKSKDVFFLTGTDEHGTKNYQTAKKEGLTPQEFVDKNSGYFKELTKSLSISNNNFIRTTDKKNHWLGVIHLWKILAKKGDIYKKKYTGCYCSGCERFITEKDLVEGRCPNHPNLEIEKIDEENYFFRLSKYSEKIKKLIQNDKLLIYPEQWKNDFLGLIKEGLTDVSFSRDKRHLPWGIPVPGDETQVLYVWGDALTNYLTGVGYPDKKYEKYWPADIHVVGKDMLRFHAGIWPGMLLSAGLELPKEIIVHGFLTVNGQKMSKSLGNVVNPLDLRKKYDSDSIRYYLCRTFPFGQDGDFSEEKLVDRHNNELADKLGNLVSRVSALAEKYGVKKTTNNLIKKLKEKEINTLMDNYELDKALNLIFAFIDNCNEYVQSNKIWESGNQKQLYELVESIKKIADLLEAFIPESADKIKQSFAGDKIRKADVLFKKIEYHANNNINKPHENVTSMTDLIKFEDFSKLDLRVAKIMKVEDIEGADKLYKLDLDVGELGKRTICAGIKQHYSKDELKHKKIIIISNLEPRMMRGIKSEGMLLAASNNEHSKVVLLSPDKDIEVGSRVS